MQAVLLILLLAVPTRAESIFGTWRLDRSQSTFTGERQPKSFTMRIEPHPKGEVLTVDRIEADGRGTSSSTILYLDGTPRNFEDFGCWGTQSSRTFDDRAGEILRKCENGLSIKLLRQSTQHEEIIIDIEERHRDGRRIERRWVLHKYSLSRITQQR